VDAAAVIGTTTKESQSRTVCLAAAQLSLRWKEGNNCRRGSSGGARPPINLGKHETLDRRSVPD